MAIKKIEIQNSTGDIYYPHTTSDIVKHGSTTLNKTLEELDRKLEEKIDGIINGINFGKFGVKRTTFNHQKTDIPLNNTTSLNGDSFALESGKIKIKKQGVYNIVLQIGINVFSSSSSAYVYIIKNGTEQGSVSVLPEVTRIQCTATIMCNVGDTISIQGETSKLYDEAAMYDSSSLTIARML